MASFKHMEIAPVVSAHEHIETKKGFLGLSTKVCYTPTRSEVDSIRNYYTPASGSAIQQFLLRFQSDPASAAKAALSLTTDPNGNYSLEMCVSRDGHFMALQLFRYSDLAYQPITEVRIYEGQEAGWLKAALLGQPSNR